ncbi:hypothetical protein D9M68_967660 [compost metagenome]
MAENNRMVKLWPIGFRPFKFFAIFICSLTNSQSWCIPAIVALCQSPFAISLGYLLPIELMIFFETFKYAIAHFKSLA